MLDDNGIQDSLVASGERIVTWYAGYRQPMLQRSAGVSVSCLLLIIIIIIIIIIISWMGYQERPYVRSDPSST